MLVSHILKSKSDDGVVTLAPGSTVAQAAETLSARRIGAIIVSRDGREVAGIVSERDVVREIGRRGAACLADRVESLMTAQVTTCTRSDTADRVLELMTQGRFRHIPVVEAGQMVGLISIGDVVKARLADLQHEKDALEGMIRGA
ncbi:CBS domain-containing protein [Rhodobacter sp. KR11]|jgi:CBS domain-containing protein|uniref:CBS domain-containing protein n=1 Tax=Rhodobacter sp. KR11 TaxID=2974588 RepID=UPI0022239A92|nr:CBS domain-containing protein [Rhodobacter sp. KR11]MCW1917556.1 CBS domain-containing protein [Rhodobacter sp. KR11]